MTPQQQEAINRMWEYLFSQGIYGSYQFPTYDSTYMGDLYNLYEDLQIPNPNMYYDTVFPRYEAEALAGNARAEQMIGYFAAIDQGAAPDAIINSPAEVNLMEEQEKADLKKYASEQATRAEAAYKQQMDLVNTAKMYGLPDPTATYNVPPEMVRELIKTKEGITPEQTSRRELATTRALEQKMLKQAAPKPEYVKRDASFGNNPLGWLYNRTVRPIIGDKPITETVEVTKPAPAKKVGGAVGARVKVLERMAEADAANEQSLIQELANQLMQRFGTPFDRALKEAAQIAASRKKGASGNWPA